MRFATTLRGVLVALILLALPAASAQEQDGLFAARRVPVDATAESAAKARDQAIVEGQRRALEIVLRRLTPEEAHARLPQVDDALAARLVESLRVENEKTSARRYIADLTVEFRPRAVSDLLRGAGVPFVERRAPPLLLLPVLENAGALVLFDDPNPWREAWAHAAEADGRLTPVVLPLGDLEDVTAVSPEAALAGDDARLSELARRYGAARWAVAVARPGESGLDLTLVRRAGTEVEAVRAEAEEEPEALLARAAELLAGRLDAEWKREAVAFASGVVGTEPAAQLSVRAPFRGLAEWLALRERLGRNPALRGFDVLAISPDGAQLVLHHVVPPERLAEVLARDGIELSVEQGFWRLALSGAQAAQ